MGLPPAGPPPLRLLLGRLHRRLPLRLARRPIRLQGRHPSLPTPCQRRFPCQQILLGSVLVNVAGSLLTPAAALQLGFAALAALRFLMGLTCVLSRTDSIILQQNFVKLPGLTDPGYCRAPREVGIGLSASHGGNVVNTNLGGTRLRSVGQPSRSTRWGTSWPSSPPCPPPPASVTAASAGPASSTFPVSAVTSLSPLPAAIPIPRLTGPGVEPELALPGVGGAGGEPLGGPRGGRLHHQPHRIQPQLSQGISQPLPSLEPL